MRMPWGKHKGELIGDVESSYLIWLLEAADKLSGNLRSGIKLELAERLDLKAERIYIDRIVERPAGEPVTVSQAKDAIDAWQREAALKWHPDRKDGDARILAEINAQADRLRRILADRAKRGD